MKVFHINCNYITTALHQIMIEHLDNNDVCSSVCVPVCDDDERKSVVTPNENVDVVNCYRKIDRVRFYYKQRKILRAVEPIFLKDKYDMVHAYTVFSDGNCALNLHRKYAVPYVVAVRDTDVNAFFKYMIHLRKRGVEILRNASAIFFLSKSYEEFVIDKYIPAQYRDEIKKKSYIQPNGIDDFWIENTSKPKTIIPSNTIKAIYVGRINKRKNVPVSVEALKILQQNGYDVSLEVIGKAEDESILKELQSCSFVQYIPQKPKEEIIKHYRNADIFIMPSLTETFGLVYPEAMSQGLPVLYTKGQGFDGQFPEGEVGYHVNPNDPNEIAEAVIKVFERYDIISENCITDTMRYRWSGICKKYRDIYKAIITNQQCEKKE